MKKSFKKTILFITKVLLISVIIFSCFNIYKRVSFKTNIDQAQNNAIAKIITTSNESIDENPNILNSKYNDSIKTEGSINEDIVFYLKNRLNLVPENILSTYFNQGGIILLTDKDISKTYYPEYNFGKIVGLHDARKNIVYISNSEYAIDYAIIHEFGHVLDSLTGWTSIEDKFKKIFNNEKDTLEVYSLDGHYKTNEREFFAEVFQEYIINNDTCKKTAPQAFDFIKNKINDL